MRLSDIGRAKMQQAFRPVLDLKAHRAKIKAEKESAEWWDAFHARMIANQLRSAKTDENIKRYWESKGYKFNA